MPALRLLLLASLGLALGAPAQAQKPSGPYEPIPFQDGKDVVWVPTEQALVDTMLDLAKVTRDDFVMDLGSGDGRIVISAARRGARALGIEFNPHLVKLSRRNAAKEGVGKRASFTKADLFETDFSRATVITMFLLPSMMLTLRPKFLALKPGTRIVSNTFTLGAWKADERVALDTKTGCDAPHCAALLWIVPARVSGIYKLPGGEFVLLQEYQVLSGSLTLNGSKFPLEGRVRGEEISFKAGGREYRGRMNGKTLELR
jgi:precorrin-6B methylase 2